MDRWPSQDDRSDNRQSNHQANFGEENAYAIPGNGFFNQTRNRPNSRYPNSSSVPPYSSPARSYNPGAEQELKQLNPSGNAYQRSSSGQYPQQGSSVPSYHGPWSTPITADRYSYNNHTSSKIAVHSGPATGGSTCFKQTVHGSSQYPQYWPQAPSNLPGNPNYYGPGQPWSQNGCSYGQNPQYYPPSHMVPSSRRMSERPRTLGSYVAPIDPVTAASPTGHQDVWNQRPQRGIDRSRLIPEDYTAALRRPFNESHRHDTPGVTATVPVLEKSKSTSSRPMSNTGRPPHSIEEDQVPEKVRSVKPRRSKPSKQRILTPEGRDHAKAIRQLPGGACKDCKKKKTKCVHRLPEDMAKLMSPSTPFTDIRTPDNEPGDDPLLFTPTADFNFDDED